MRKRERKRERVRESERERKRERDLSHDGEDGIVMCDAKRENGAPFGYREWASLLQWRVCVGGWVCIVCGGVCGCV